MNKEKKIDFFNPEHITEAEAERIFKQYPIDFGRVTMFLNKEPGIKEAFLQYSNLYVNEFANVVGVELRPATYQKLHEILLICMTTGYMTKENLFKSKLAEAIKKGEEEDASTSPS